MSLTLWFLCVAVYVVFCLLIARLCATNKMDEKDTDGYPFCPECGMDWEECVCVDRCWNCEIILPEGTHKRCGSCGEDLTSDSQDEGRPDYPMTKEKNNG